MKSLANPPTGCVVIAKVVLIMMGEKIKMEDDNKKCWSKGT